MTQYRYTSLFSLYPVVEFSFTQRGMVYTLIKREVNHRTGRYTYTIRKKGTRKPVKRYFTFNELCETFVILRQDVKNCPQPKSNICLTYTCF